jgi:transglutaminase-like putative cysteine protease
VADAVHATGYAYKSPSPPPQRGPAHAAVGLRQNVILNRVETVPATRNYRYVDYWGTAVTAFDLHAPHTELEVTASSVVETDKSEPPAKTITFEVGAEGSGTGSTRCSPRRTTPRPVASNGWAGGSSRRTPTRTTPSSPRRGGRTPAIRSRHHRRALVGLDALREGKESARISRI